MSTKNTKRITRIKDTLESITDESGTTSIQQHEEYGYDTEVQPDYVKIYFDTVFAFKGIKTAGLSPILLACLKRMTYANDENPMIITIISYTKKQIAEETGKSVQTVDRALKQFVEHKLFFKVARSVYQANAQIFGKGDWKDVKKLRQLQAKFDFMTGEVKAQIEYDDKKTEPKEDKKQSELELDILYEEDD